MVDNGPVITLTCCCCYGEASGRQWHNRDTGYGLCSSCADTISNKETPETMHSYYGIEGIHYFKAVEVYPLRSCAKLWGGATREIQKE